MSSADQEYLALAARVLEGGKPRGSRSGGTRSRFSERLVLADVSEEFPLLTTKRVFWRGVVEELLWFLSGSTDVSVLRERDVHIWDGNTTREYLDNLGLTTYPAHSEAGPIYGFQWRHSGAQYVDCRTDYTGKGVDQISAVVAGIREDPNSRRLLLDAWSPSQLSQMALPPCHYSYQFYVDGDRLDCLMSMRSCDIFLGLPFNMASSAALMHLVAAACDLRPRELTISIGDAHLYNTHLDAVREQLARVPRPAPTLAITYKPPGDLKGLDPAIFRLDGYEPYAKISAPMSA